MTKLKEQNTTWGIIFYFSALLQAKSSLQKDAEKKVKWCIAHVNILAFAYVGTGIRIKTECKLMVLSSILHKARSFWLICSGPLLHAEAGHLHTDLQEEYTNP